MRFILNFFFFGLLFYIIWLYFPEAFTTLVSWASQVFDFFRDLFHNLSNRFSHSTTEPPSSTTPEHIKSLFQYLSVFLK